MALLESAVVVYARAFLYPNGFAFPLVPMEKHLVYMELFRELATMIMLFAPGALMVRSSVQRFAYYCFAFGVWDIFYYVFLKVLLDWPASLLDQDILFLVPVLWVGPVLAPCMASIGMILLGLVLLRNARMGCNPRSWRFSMTWCLSGAVILGTFILPPAVWALQHGGWCALWVVPSEGKALAQFSGYVPHDFAWAWFLFACAVTGGSILQLARRRTS
jgi:hypothetical protein